MKKLFFALCFIVLAAAPTAARVTEVLEQSQIPERQQQTNISQPKVTEVTPEDFGSFLLDRLQRINIQERSELSTASTYTEPSLEAQKAMQEANKSGFEKIYDQAMKRALQEPQLKQQEQAQYRNDITLPYAGQAESRQTQQQAWQQPNFPTISITLPDGSRQTVPAREHIPYLLNNIQILPDGMIKFDETLVVVANGRKLKQGLTKVLPRYIYSRQKKRQKIDYSLLSVTANGQQLPYKIKEEGDFVFLVPEKDYLLEPGVYTYNFQYVNDNALWNYKDFREFYWDISGSAWNLVIGKAGTAITMPPGVTPIGQQVFIGYPQFLDSSYATPYHPAPETWAYVSRGPLYIGEGFHVIISLPKDAVMPATAGKFLIKSFLNHGDVIISILALAAIWISFILSWKFVRRNKGQLKVSLRKNAVMLRYLAFGKYDLKSIGAFVLELYKKNIIDIQQADDTILLIKRTDNLNTLTPAEKKAVKQLFTNDEPVFNVNKNNLLKIRRASVHLEKDLNSRLHRFILKLNSGYLFFSLGMLAISELYMAFFSNNIKLTFGYLLGATAVMGFGILLFRISTRRRWLSIILKIFGVLTACVSFVLMSGLISHWAAGFTLLSIVIIARYTSIYAQRNGLLSGQINDALNTRNYLLNHKDNILLGKELINQQPNILALDITEDFRPSGEPKEYDKLRVIEDMINKIS